MAAAAKLVIESDGLFVAITREATKLVEYHGKAGYRALGNVSKIATMVAAMEGKMLLNPCTHEMHGAGLRSISAATVRG